MHWTALVQRVIDARPDLRVHFYGYEDSDNEFVKLNQIRYEGSDLAMNRDANEWETTRISQSFPVDQSRRTEGV